MYLTSKEVAQRLKISLRSAQRLIKKHPHINVGVGTKREILRIEESILNEYLTTYPHERKSNTKKASVPNQSRIIHQANTKITKMKRR